MCKPIFADFTGIRFVRQSLAVTQGKGAAFVKAYSLKLIIVPVSWPFKAASKRLKWTI